MKLKNIAMITEDKVTEIFCILITGAHVSDKNPDVLKILAKRLYGKLFADKRKRVQIPEAEKGLL